MQAKLLTVLQNRKITRIGSNKVIPVDIRLLSATNKNIQEMVDSGTFREDLLYRLNTIHLEIPPLRERGNDIHLFIDYFMQRYAAKYEKKDISLHEHALEKLCSYHWPGNIRELQHAIEKAIILCEGNVIRPKDIFVKQTWNPQFSTTVPNLEEVERQAIAAAIRQNDGNLTATAEQLGISRQTLYNKIKRSSSDNHGIQQTSIYGYPELHLINNRCGRSRDRTCHYTYRPHSWQSAIHLFAFFNRSFGKTVE